MEILWQILVQFIFRLTFGVAFAMALTSPRDVAAGFFRVHLWVLLGLNTLAALAGYSSREVAVEMIGTSGWQVSWISAVVLAVSSYVGAVLWLYENRRLGRLLLFLIAGVAFGGAWCSLAGAADRSAVLGLLDIATGGLLLGATLTAMLLGHWYLNSPTMKLAPLRRLLLLLLAAVVARAAFSAGGVALQVVATEPAVVSWWLFLALRWLAGLVASLVLVALTWQTLKIPNTQSATGILYATVILVFIGELTAQLLSAETVYPV